MGVGEEAKKGRAQVLIIEDTLIAIKKLKSVLEQNGYYVFVAGNFKEALALINQYKPLIVISDSRWIIESNEKNVHSEHLDQLLNISPTVIYSLKVTPTSFQGPFPITFISENVKVLFGYEVSECLVDPNWWINQIHPEDRSNVLLLQATLFEQDSIDYEYRFRHKNGTYRWVHDKLRLLRDTNRNPLEIVGSWIDITERRWAEEMITHLAYYDPLTNLPNRALFHDRITQAITYARRNKRMLAAMILDLDRFKIINETLGHSVGDRLLQDVANRLKECLRESDTIARLGGDEFALLLTQIVDGEDASKIAQKILETFEPSFHVEGQELHTTLSIGVALYPRDGEDTQTLLKSADNALNRAKEQGRNTYQLHTSTMSIKAFERLTFETGLRHALEREEFVLYYQPQVNTNTKKIVGMEALLRWRHPNLGVISPMKFIPLAEETGLIIPISEWVLRSACAQSKALQEEGFPPLYVAVNLSARHFKHKDLVSTIARILNETGFNPNHLELEVTESIIMENAETTIATLRELKAMGVCLSIDDFGTGYSSLSYLKRFPIDILKIDQSFVRDISTDADDAAIATAIISLAHSLKLKVIAEGVETEEQLIFLHTHECDRVQGYLFSKPIPVEAFKEVLLRSPSF
jgi:diguanylate cyclase (GGDEF)-like protein/PAS domain S-box-containing protein